jgi:hypothetical protein
VDPPRVAAQFVSLLSSSGVPHPAADRDATGDGRIVGAIRSRAPGGSSRGVPQSHQHEAGRRSICPAAQFCAPNLNCGPRIGRQTTTGFGGPGSRRCSPVKGRPDKRSVKPGASGTRHARVQAKARKASSPSEARIGPPPAAYRPYGTLCSGCVRAARVVVETAHCRLVTRERMAVLCRGSND